MNARNRLTVLAAALCLVIVIGEAAVYAGGLYSYDADAEYADGKFSYSAYSSGYDVMNAVTVSGGVPTERLFIYLDPFHSDYYQEAYEKSKPYYLDQEYYAKQIAVLLKVRGFCDTECGGPSEASEYLSETAENPSGCGFMVISYSVPAEIYSGNAGDPLPAWVRSGGTLYWMSSEIGRFCSDGAGLREIPGGSSVFIGDTKVNTVLRNSDAPSSELTNALCLRSSNLMFSLENKNSQILGFTDGTFSSIAFAKSGKGSVCVIGGGFDMNEIDDIGQIIAAGINYGTVLCGAEKSSIRGKITGELDSPPDGRLYIFIGGTYARYGESFHERDPHGRHESSAALGDRRGNGYQACPRRILPVLRCGLLGARDQKHARGRGPLRAGGLLLLAGLGIRARIVLRRAVSVSGYGRDFPQSS